MKVALLGGEGDVDLKIVKVPVLDTGIGREAGYENDAALIEAARQQREALPPEVRALLDTTDRQLERRVLGCE